MTFEEMSEFIKRTAQFDTADARSLPYCALGLAGEAGEVADLALAGLSMIALALHLNKEAGDAAELVKKAIRSNKPIDKIKAVMELGDVQWYVGRFAHALGVTPEQVVQCMVMKLERRNQRQAAGLEPKDHEGERIEASIILGIPL